MATPKIKKTIWQKVRKLFNDIHLWLGLGSGLIVIVICFSGTAYVYNTELTEMAAPHLYEVKPAPGAERIAPEQLLMKVQELSGGKVTAVNIPANPERTYQFNVRTKDDKSRFGTTYMVDPYTGDIVGNSLEKNSTKEFMGTMFSLHRWLLLDKVEKPILSSMTNKELGSSISGWTTIIFTLGCITGLIIWFPQKIRTWRQGLKIKLTGNWKRVNHDLHNSLAFYSLIFLLVMGLTGPQWSFEWYRDGLQRTLGTYKPKPQGISTANPGNGEKNSEKENSHPPQISAGVSTSPVEHEQQPLSITAYVAAANKLLSYKGNYMVSLPADTKAPVSITKTRVGFFAPAAGDKLSLDQYTAAAVKVDIFRNKPFNERIAGSIKALHVGNMYGGFTKLLYFIACLIATTLPVTGTLIWLNKLKKKRKRKPFAFQPVKEPLFN
ncbi:PepSY-associated TM helix domain-containing protein [Agriterribacter sp.]|uniref:PepSY-associated TM helix domain-containing protein n=1 Tax=Agriterribacter sp. TaxID=2821509 RepID=UPI002C879F4B|nr:PepSY-associated TM helix domain-containing protein [Agriterribacter sp.]HTN06047.1 PepSY-associated TM helix domain-containing protein [Agriterribacter sp.]